MTPGVDKDFFTSFPNSFSHASPKLSTAAENDMDIDLYEDDDDGEDFDSGTKLTCPGEPITSPMTSCGAFSLVQLCRRHCAEVQSKHSGHETSIDQDTMTSTPSVAETIEQTHRKPVCREVKSNRKTQSYRFVNRSNRPMRLDTTEPSGGGGGGSAVVFNAPDWYWLYWVGYGAHMFGGGRVSCGIGGGVG